MGPFELRNEGKSLYSAYLALLVPVPGSVRTFAALAAGRFACHSTFDSKRIDDRSTGEIIRRLKFTPPPGIVCTIIPVLFLEASGGKSLSE